MYERANRSTTEFIYWSIEALNPTRPDPAHRVAYNLTPKEG